MSPVLRKEGKEYVLYQYIRREDYVDMNVGISQELFNLKITEFLASRGIKNDSESRRKAVQALKEGRALVWGDDKQVICYRSGIRSDEVPMEEPERRGRSGDFNAEMNIA